MVSVSQGPHVCLSVSDATEATQPCGQASRRCSNEWAAPNVTWSPNVRSSQTVGSSLEFKPMGCSTYFAVSGGKDKEL